MPNGLKIILAVIAGVFAGGMTIAIVEALGHAVVSGQTLFIVAAIGLGIAGFTGGSVAVWIGKQWRLAPVIGVLLAGLSLVNVFSFKHPSWFVPVAFVLLAIGIWLAITITKSRVSKP